jgi:ABC-type nitrate/sulfonate/bicarbonate transport system substrate-binding protein
MSKQWWEPELADAEWIARLRKDYPEKCAGMSDDWVADHFNETGGKYVVTWDHTGDAYEQFEKLADAYLKLKAKQSPDNPGAST